MTANKDFTLKTRPLRREDLDDFVACYRAEDRHARAATWGEANPEGRWRAYDAAEIVARNKCGLDVFWLRDASLESTDNLRSPDVIAREIVEDLRAAQEPFEDVAAELGERAE